MTMVPPPLVQSLPPRPISGCAPTDNAGDCAVLLAAYAAWGNQPASWAAGIAAGSSYCSWDVSSVTCTNGRVTSLNVYGKQLSGTIPAALGGLTSLQSLSLFNNTLSGTIPAALGNLTALTGMCEIIRFVWLFRHGLGRSYCVFAETGALQIICSVEPSLQRLAI